MADGIRYLVLDTAWNRENHLEIIGQVFDYPIPYCAVKLLKEGENDGSDATHHVQDDS